jgi:7-carboxy-7-deazaguanine synthase
MLNIIKEDSLNIIELYLSVQGETHLVGLPTAFVRLAGCNLRCSWCDTPYSFGRGTPATIESILKGIKDYNCKHVCITGGEPLMQKNVHALMTQLCDLGYTVSIETGGSLTIKGIDPRVITILDIKCPGSAMDGKNYWQNLEILQDHDEIKFVILDEKDYLYSKDVCERYNLYDRKHAPLFSPVHGLLDPKLLVDWILKDAIRVRLNLQMHKYVWSPETKGV